MTNVTIQLTDKEAKALKIRTGERTVSAALKAWIASATASYSAKKLREALSESSKEEKQGKGRRFKSGQEAVKWLEN